MLSFGCCRQQELGSVARFCVILCDETTIVIYCYMVQDERAEEALIFHL